MSFYEQTEEQLEALEENSKEFGSASQAILTARSILALCDEVRALRETNDGIRFEMERLTGLLQDGITIYQR